MVYNAWRRRFYIAVSISVLIIALLVWVLVSVWLNNSTQSLVVLNVATDAKYQVSNVVDGDTIEVTKGVESITVRLIGVDSPEKYTTRTGSVECYGAESSARLEALLSGKEVDLESDPSQELKDKYGRSLFYVFLDGANVNQQMVREGYAYEYTYDKPYKYQSNFLNDQSTAKADGLGLWASSTCGGERVVSGPGSSAQSYNYVDQTPLVEIPSVSSSCDVNYEPCVQVSSADLDCRDISTSVRVVGVDVYRFDRDGDGYGCESN